MKTLHDPEVRSDMLRRIRTLVPDAPARWGRMSVDQMLWHLNGSLEEALGVRTLEPLDTPLSRSVVKWAALYGPWPRGKVKTNPELVASEHHDFTVERGRLLALVEEMGRRDPAGAWPRSSPFGPMSGRQWSRLEYRHLDHHLTQFGV